MVREVVSNWTPMAVNVVEGNCIFGVLRGNPNSEKIRITWESSRFACSLARSGLSRLQDPWNKSKSSRMAWTSVTGVWKSIIHTMSVVRVSKMPTKERPPKQTLYWR